MENGEDLFALNRLNIHRFALLLGMLKRKDFQDFLMETRR
jgi:hypothetical protein